MRKNIILLLTATLLVACVEAQTLFIDLSEFEYGKEIKIDPLVGKFDKIILKSTFPRFEYNVYIKEENQQIPEIELPDGTLRSNNDTCKVLEEKLSEFKEYLKIGDDENEIGNKIKLMESLIKDDNKCKDAKLVEAFDTLKTKTLRKISLKKAYKKQNGKNITILISREERNWKFLIEGDPVGSFQVTYGFGFTSLNGQKEYYSKSMLDTMAFTITKKNENDILDLNYTPAIFVSFLPYKKYGKPFYFSPTIGLGFDTENPVVFLGLSAFYYQNIGISLGVAGQKRAFLNNRYNENDIISENLDFDQLHEEKYRPLFYFSVNFRLKENPFSKKENPEDK